MRQTSTSVGVSKRSALLARAPRADVVRLQVGVQRRRMAAVAAHPVAVEQLPAALGRRAEPAVDQVRAGHRPQRLQIGVDGRRLLFRPVGRRGCA